jgi:hypothetical protein
MATRSVRKSKKRIQNVKTHPSVFGWARSFEVGLLISSLFWAVEVGAKESAPQELSQQGLERFSLEKGRKYYRGGGGRSPASAPAKEAKNFEIIADLQTSSFHSDLTQVQNSMLHSRSKSRGDAISSAFKENPLFAPPLVEVVRFRAF